MTPGTHNCWQADVSNAVGSRDDVLAIVPVGLLELRGYRRPVC